MTDILDMHGLFSLDESRLDEWLAERYTQCNDATKPAPDISFDDFGSDGFNQDLDTYLYEWTEEGILHTPDGWGVAIYVIDGDDGWYYLLTVRLDVGGTFFQVAGPSDDLRGTDKIAELAVDLVCTANTLLPIARAATTAV